MGNWQTVTLPHGLMRKLVPDGAQGWCSYCGETARASDPYFKASPSPTTNSPTITVSPPLLRRRDTD
jgi:hypothetical protein